MRVNPGTALATAASLLLIVAFMEGADPESQEVLTTAAQVRALSIDEARQAMPVHLRGVFMGEADPPGIAFVMQDETEGIYVQAPPDLVATLHRGDLLEVRGVTDPGGYAPYVAATDLQRLGRGQVPEPIEVSMEDLYAGEMDAQWIEFPAIVRSVEPLEPTDAAPPPPGTRFETPVREESPEQQQAVKMKLASGETRVMVEVNGALNPEDYVDAEILLRGLCFNLHNRNRQFVKPFVQVPLGVQPVIVKRPLENPFEEESIPVGNLLRFEQGNHQRGHRVHIRGIVVHHQPGSHLWVRDGDHSLLVETAQTEVLQPGEEVDVLGFPEPGEYSPMLEDAEFRKRGFLHEPTPEVLTDLTSALQNDANLVQLEAKLIEVRQFKDRIELIIEWHGLPIRTQMHLSEGAAPAIHWQTGSIVRVMGICTVEANETGPLGGLWIPQTFHLLLRSTSDMVVIQSPPWWNAERIAYLLFAFLLLAIATIAVIMWISRRRLREKELQRSMAEAEFTAILSERNRVAREIHDTLSQSLGAISVQLEIARMHANELGADLRKHLATAHQLARSALAEARNSIWNMRSQVLEECDLGEALTRILNKLTDETQVKGEVTVIGTKRRLSPITENNLLRIGQEAIANAVKHANANWIKVNMTFDNRLLRLSIEDDGKGFEHITRQVGERRSFGLVGIKERVDQMGGSIDIRSASGKGTTITVSVSD